MKDPLKIIQTRKNIGHLPAERGNCLPTAIACFMHLHPEEVFQVQEHYDEDNYQELLDDWIKEKGWKICYLEGHKFDNSFYLVSGLSPRNPNIWHICIYQNGKLWHDPHPDGTGIVTEEDFQELIKIDP